MELVHFSHHHRLIFEQDYKGEGLKVSCDGCRQCISSGPGYVCTTYSCFFLHKVCAELPKEMKHPMHPEHQLSLLPSPPNYPQSLYSQSPCECGVCRQPCEGFTYNCSLCKFDVDIMCALMVHKIEHECHPHPLTPLQWPLLFWCDACGTRHEGTSFKCSTCKFWVNQKCASLPRTIGVNNHDHLLSLTYSFPYERFKFSSYCKVCVEKIERVNWAYCCADCKYFAHLNCSHKITGMEVTRYPLLPPPLSSREELILPRFDESTSLISHFVKEVGLRGKNEKLTKIYHIGHHHPLFLDKRIDDESSAGCKLIACDLCAQPVSAPFYCCTKCNFILHECCAAIPIELQHPSHWAHPLLLNRWPSECAGLLICQVCYMSCNGVSYGCVECDFFLHLRCASLSFLIRKGAPSIVNIKHETHQHALKWKHGRYFCSACHESSSGLGLKCTICSFDLHPRCALLPWTICNKYDRHPFSLLYFGTDEDYYCEICEEEINPNCWFYDCGDCRRSLHVNCILPPPQQLFRFHPLPQQFITHEAHPHTLALREGCFDRCAACKHRCYGFGFVCEENCNFSLHTRCASLPLTVAHRYDEHPLILIYSGNQVKTVCQICVVKENGNCWFYHCAKCNKYFHPLCVQFVEKSKLRTGLKVSLGGHQHLLTSVKHPKDINPCSSCGELVEDWCLECADCTSVVLHERCAYNEANELILLHQRDRKLPDWSPTSKPSSLCSTGTDTDTDTDTDMDMNMNID